MPNSPEDGLTLAVKVNRLFDVCHARDQAEPTSEAVAASIGEIIGRPVSVDEVDSVRNESDRDPDPALIDGLTKLFQVPREYLTTTGIRVIELDNQLRLLAAVRDAGIRSMALRGNISSAHPLLTVVNQIPRDQLRKHEAELTA